MGGDFLGAIVWLPEGEQPDWEAGRRTIRKAAGAVEIWMDGVALDPAEAAALLAQDLAFFQDHWDNGGREAGRRRMPGLRVLFTGGMSDGDPPTALMESIERLRQAGVLRACGFNRGAVRNDAAIQSLILAIEAAGKDSSDLDGFVHDAKGEEAAAIDNAGLEAQLEYLTEGGANVDWLRERLGLDEKGGRP